MGYDGKKIVELNRSRVVSGRKVEKFWGKINVALAVAAVVFFLLLVLILFIVFPPTATLPRQQGQGQQKRQLEPLVPPLLFHQLPPSSRQKREKAVPIHWSDHHGGHHGHHDHYYSPYYSPPPAIIVRPWGHDPYYTPYGYGYEDEERRPYFELHRRPNGETQMRWGFQ